MADSELAVYIVPVSPGLLASTAAGIRPNTKLITLLSVLMPLLAFATTRFLPAPRVHEAR